MCKPWARSCSSPMCSPCQLVLASGLTLLGSTGTKVFDQHVLMVSNSCCHVSPTQHSRRLHVMPVSPWSLLLAMSHPHHASSHMLTPCHLAATWSAWPRSPSRCGLPSQQRCRLSSVRDTDGGALLQTASSARCALQGSCVLSNQVTTRSI